MWRALEDKWRKQGLVTRETPDRDLAALYSIFNDFNYQHDGVTLQDFLECRVLMLRQIKMKRRSYRVSPSKANSLFDKDFDVFEKYGGDQ